MKWVTLVCLLIFSIATESRHLQKRHHHEEHAPRHIHDIVQKVGIPVVEKLLVVLVAQDCPHYSVEEHLKIKEKLMEVVKHCEEHPEEADCKKSGMTLYHDTLCKQPEIEELHPWFTECCAKQEEAERNKCFMVGRRVEVPPYKLPDVAEACKEYKEHPEDAFFYFLSNMGIRHKDLYPPAILGFGIQYNQVCAECCEAEEKSKCFYERISQIKKLTDYVENKQKQKCHIIESFPERVFEALNLIQVSQRFGHAEYKSAEKLTLEIVHLNKDCCSGDFIECMVERMEVTDHICADKEHISSKLGPCCDKGPLERTPCLLALPNEESGLPKDMTKFYEDEHVCEEYQKDKRDYLAHFTFEYSRRHQDSSPQSCLRVASGYEMLLEKCCAAENHQECLKQAPVLLEAALKENQELVKENCGALKTLGFKDYSILILSRYAGRMPQVTALTLVEITLKMVKTGVYCCALPENKIQVCAEEKLDLLLGEMCEREKKTFVNDNVHNCCVSSYGSRRKCFTSLGRYDKYVAPAWDESKLHFNPDMCKGSEEEQLQKKLILLAEVLKMKPDIDNEKLKGLVEAFRTTFEKCCAAENCQSCMDDEKGGILAHIL